VIGSSRSVHPSFFSARRSTIDLKVVVKLLNG
jgi:hypothetical protein